MRKYRLINGKIRLKAPVFLHEISRYLNGLELMQIPKPLREDLGGGTKEFTVKDVSGIPKRRQASTFPHESSMHFYRRPSLKASRSHPVS